MSTFLKNIILLACLTNSLCANAASAQRVNGVLHAVLVDDAAPRGDLRARIENALSRYVQNHTRSTDYATVEYLSDLHPVPATAAEISNNAVVVPPLPNGPGTPTGCSVLQRWWKQRVGPLASDASPMIVLVFAGPSTAGGHGCTEFAQAIVGELHRKRIALVWVEANGVTAPTPISELAIKSSGRVHVGDSSLLGQPSTEGELRWLWDASSSVDQWALRPGSRATQALIAPLPPVVIRPIFLQFHAQLPNVMGLSVAATVDGTKLKDGDSTWWMPLEAQTQLSLNISVALAADAITRPMPSSALSIQIVVDTPNNAVIPGQPVPPFVVQAAPLFVHVAQPIIGRPRAPLTLRAEDIRTTPSLALCTFAPDVKDGSNAADLLLAAKWRVDVEALAQRAKAYPEYEIARTNLLPQGPVANNGKVQFSLQVRAAALPDPGRPLALAASVTELNQWLHFDHPCNVRLPMVVRSEEDDISIGLIVFGVMIFFAAIGIAFHLRGRRNGT